MQSTRCAEHDCRCLRATMCKGELGDFDQRVGDAVQIVLSTCNNENFALQTKRIIERALPCERVTEVSHGDGHSTVVPGLAREPKGSLAQLLCLCILATSERDPRKQPKSCA